MRELVLLMIRGLAVLRERIEDIRGKPPPFIDTFDPALIPIGTAATADIAGGDVLHHGCVGVDGCGRKEIAKRFLSCCICFEV